MNLKILFGTVTGNAEECAAVLGDKAREAGIEAEVSDVANYDATELQNEQTLAVVMSTWGEGDPPDDAEDFCYDLYDGKAGDLSNVRFALCALGDTSYDDFCGCGRKVEEALVKAGATKIMDRVELDVDFEDGFEEWADRLVKTLKG